MSNFNAGIERKQEDKKNNIQNDKSRGSLNVFSEKTIKLLEEIVMKADDFFNTIPQESEGYNLSDLFTHIPIYLIPYEKLVIWKKVRCESSFAKKMRKLYEAEKERISKSPQEECRNEYQLRKKYSPWICPPGSPCTSCHVIQSAPLGYFDPEKKEICICLDRIIDICNKMSYDVNAISALVIIHELGHALMHNEACPFYNTLFGYWAEESLANKIALKYLAIASMLLCKPDLYSDAKSMVCSQTDAYELGLYLFESNASNWHTLQANKLYINETIGSQWVDAVCGSTIQFEIIQALFYRAFQKESVCPSLIGGFTAWLGKFGRTEDYVAVIMSQYIGVVLKNIMGWAYDTLAECTSSIEIDKARNIILGGGIHEREFNKATNGNVSTALAKYRDYLVSLGK